MRTCRALSCLAVAALAFAGLAAPAHAVACRNIPTVEASSPALVNTSMGGHVTQHILGMQPPPGTSQKGKTLFSQKKKYEDAWRQYQFIANPVNCSGKQAEQSVSLEKLGIANMDAFSCKAANASGECTEWDSYIAKSVFFGFLLVDGKWILNTCFPEPAP